MRKPHSCPAVLIAEDERLFALLLEAWIEDREMKPLGPVSSIQAAKDLLEEVGNPDAAILDVILHGETVYPIAEILSDRHVPFLFVTGCAFSPATPFQDVPVLVKPTAEHLVLQLLFNIMDLNPRSSFLI